MGRGGEKRWFVSNLNVGEYVEMGSIGEVSEGRGSSLLMVRGRSKCKGEDSSWWPYIYIYILVVYEPHTSVTQAYQLIFSSFVFIIILHNAG